MATYWDFEKKEKMLNPNKGPAHDINNSFSKILSERGHFNALPKTYLKNKMQAWKEGPMWRGSDETWVFILDWKNFHCLKDQ